MPTPPPPAAPAAAAAAAAAATAATAAATSLSAALKANSRRLDKSEKNVLIHLLQAPKLTNGDIAKIIDVDERTISRRRKQLRTLGHLSPERNVKGAEKLRPWHLEKIIALLGDNEDYQLKDVQDFLQKEFDLHVTVSTISRQLSRAGHARARRPGYKNTRPDLQAEAQVLQQHQHQHQHQQEAVAQLQEAPLPPPPPPPPPPPSTFLTAGQQLQSPAHSQAQQGVADAQQDGTATMPGNVKLACPFLKLDPQRYINAPFCQSTWHSARDVKDHVFRQHMQPRHRCNRCMEIFDDNTALVFHQRLPEPCPLAEWSTIEGCDEEQKERIRKGDKGDENTRWKRMFRILFPEVQVPPDGIVYEDAYFVTAPASIYPNLVPWQGEQPAQVTEGMN